ncbi:MAG: HlyD family secretion protein [Saprospiraceae bacterium]|nr:HlyD family secretion protein [Saprospiraceae bacterium]
MKKIMPFILGAVILGAAYFAYSKISFMLNNEDTENSQLETNIVPVAPKVAGYVTEVLVKDNQLVKAGDTIIKIDDRDQRLKVLQAEINLKNAEANVALIQANKKAVSANIGTSDANIQVSNAGVEAAKAAVATANANVEAAKIRVWKATQDYNRYAALLKEKSATQQQFDAMKAEKEAAEAALTIAEKQVATAQSQVNVSDKQTSIGNSQKSAVQSQVAAAQSQITLAQTQVEQRKAELEMAKLQLSYYVVTAPISGTISKKNVQIGQYINVAQSLMSIVDGENIWVVANFKETQVAKMKVGQKVKLKIDAYKGRDFEGTIESFAAATGAKFSLLPPDNATGNFVKVVQRIPVRIALTNKNNAETPLRAGMSVDVVVPIN